MAGRRVWEDLFQTLRRNAVQDLREALKDPWAVTAIAGHSEEVERKYYLGHVRQADLDRITGTGGDDPQARELMQLWGKLKTEQRSKLLALLRAATTGATTATKTATKSVSTTEAAQGGNEKSPQKTGSNQNAPRRTATTARLYWKIWGRRFSCCRMRCNPRPTFAVQLWGDRPRSGASRCDRRLDRQLPSRAP